MTTLPGITHVIYRYRVFYDIRGNESQDELLAHEFMVKKLAHSREIQEYTIGTFLRGKFKGLEGDYNGTN